MNEAPVENDVPETPDVEFVLVDPLQEIEILRELNRRWRRAAIGSVSVILILFVISIVQFAGTFTTARLLYQAREEAARNQKEAKQSLQQLQQAEKKFNNFREITNQALEDAGRLHSESRMSRAVLYDLNQQNTRASKLLQQLQLDVAEARENLIAVESMRLILEQDEEARAKIFPCTYADPRQRCPFEPGTGRRVPELE